MVIHREKRAAIIQSLGPFPIDPAANNRHKPSPRRHSIIPDWTDLDQASRHVEFGAV